MKCEYCSICEKNLAKYVIKEDTCRLIFCDKCILIYLSQETGIKIYEIK
jgi:hypothetical protein